MGLQTGIEASIDVYIDPCMFDKVKLELHLTPLWLFVLSFLGILSVLWNIGRVLDMATSAELG